MPEPDRPVAAVYRSKVHYWFIGGAVAMFVAAYTLELTIHAVTSGCAMELTQIRRS